jgi:uncharacterized protein (DUF1501 family)
MTTSRRSFLRATLQGSSLVALGGVAPRFLVEAAESDPRWERILVVVQLTGGNDGLNTVVPFTNAEYYKQRPKLAVPKSDVLKINDSLGFHPSMKGFANLLEAGRLAIVQGVGYPNPNRSHFESMDIWHTCARKTDRRTTGWIGRTLEALKANDVSAMHIGGGKQPLALTSETIRVPSVESLEQFRLELQRQESAADVQNLAESARQDGDELLSFLQTNTTTALDVSQRLQKSGKDYKPKAIYPQSDLARKLVLASQLIASDFPARVYYVELDGFDTHSQQPAAHAGLLRQLGEAVDAFQADMHEQGQGNRVLTMVFSEFGRRVAENASQGTDHGAAAPMFLVGETVKAGVIGKLPSLTDLEEGDLKHHTDFRQVYATVLERWLGQKSDALLGGSFKTVDALPV